MIPNRNGSRAVVTGIGVLSAIGNSYPEFSRALAVGVDGTAPITAFDTSQLRSPNACEVKGFDPFAFFPARAARRMDRSSQFVLAAVHEALKQSGLDVAALDKERCGVVLGSTLGGTLRASRYYETLKTKGRARPSLLKDYPLHSPGYRICMEYGFLGPNLVISTACTASNIAIGYGLDMIRQDEVDVVVVGGYDTMSKMTVAGFNVMRNVSPDRCRPFDKNRQGLILGEGTALLILESDVHCRARGGIPLAEIKGYAISSDAYHMTAPDVTARGPVLAMEHALRDAGVNPQEIDVVNAHGTGTLYNDMIESKAVLKVFGDWGREIPVTSTKSMHGHTLGAAGGMGVAAAIVAIREGVVPPTINYETPDEKCPVNVAATARPTAAKLVLSNSLGFGGNNCSVVIGAC